MLDILDRLENGMKSAPFKLTFDDRERLLEILLPYRQHPYPEHLTALHILKNLSGFHFLVWHCPKCKEIIGGIPLPDDFVKTWEKSGVAWWLQKARLTR